MTRSIFGKLFLSFTGIILMSFLLFGIMYLYLFHVQLYAGYEEDFAEKRTEITDQLSLAEEYNWSTEETGASLDVILSGSDYDVHVYENDISKYNCSMNDPARHLLTADLKEIQAEGHWQDGGFDYVMAGPLVNGTLTGMTMTFSGLEEAYLQAVFMIAVSFLTVIVIAAVVLFFITRRMTRPLRDMNAIAKQMSKGDFSRQVDAETKDEIGELGRTLNEMAVELASIENTRKTILTNISHDLRTPLTSVKGFLIALEDGTIPEEKRAGYYSRMRLETDRVITLVNAILELSRLESGNITLDRETYTLVPQLERICSTLEHQLTERNVQVSIQTELNNPKISGDYERMNRVWENLLVNAIRYANEGSTITVNIDKTETMIETSIHNQGEAIPENQLPYLFDRFYKGEDARTKASGSGIGLSIVKSIVVLHGGTVLVRSDNHQGTTFTVSLPSIN